MTLIEISTIALFFIAQFNCTPFISKRDALNTLTKNHDLSTIYKRREVQIKTFEVYKYSKYHCQTYRCTFEEFKEFAEDWFGYKKVDNHFPIFMKFYSGSNVMQVKDRAYAMHKIISYLSEEHRYEEEDILKNGCLNPTIKKIKILNAKTVDFEMTSRKVVGISTAGSCAKTAQTLALNQRHCNTQTITIGSSRSNSTSNTFSHQFSAGFKIGFEGFDFSSSYSYTSTKGKTHSFSRTKSESDQKTECSSHSNSQSFKSPGAGITYAVVDKLTTPEQEVDADIHMICPDGRDKVIREKLIWSFSQFSAVHFINDNFELPKKKCYRGLNDCINKIQVRYDTQKQNLSIDKLEQDFRKCQCNQSRGYHFNGKTQECENVRYKKRWIERIFK